MPKGKGYGNPHPKTKAGKQRKVGKVMSEFKEGKLTSHGRRVTSRKQAIAIAMSESGQAKPKLGLGKKRTATSMARQRSRRSASKARQRADKVAREAQQRQSR